MQVEGKFDDGGLIARYNRAPSEIDKAVRKAVNEVSGLVRSELAGRRGLTKYPRHQRNTPTPSPPGEPPAQITSRLARSVKEAPIRRLGFAHYERDIFPDMSYAIHLEFGTKHMPARPFVEPAFRRVFGNFQTLQKYHQALHDTLTKGG